MLMYLFILGNLLVFTKVQNMANIEKCSLSSYDLTQFEMGNGNKLVEKRYLLTFILVTTLFALWGFANDITNPMVAAFQTIMELSAAKASLIQFAFYGAYFCIALPASLFIRRFSYKSGVILGLALYATGAILFMPAAKAASYAFYLIAIYILASGCSILETTANPYILSMGSPKTATRRLNIAQSFRSILSTIEMYS